MKILLTAAATVALLSALAAPAMAERNQTSILAPNGDGGSGGGGSSHNSIGRAPRVQPAPSIGSAQPLPGTSNRQPRPNGMADPKPTWVPDPMPSDYDPQIIPPAGERPAPNEPMIPYLGDTNDRPAPNEPMIPHVGPADISPAADSVGLPSNVQVIGRPQREPVTLDIQTGQVTQQMPQGDAERAERDREAQQQLDAANAANARELQRMQGVLQQMQPSTTGGTVNQRRFRDR